MTYEVASVEADNHRVFAWLNGSWDEDINGDGVAVDYLIGDVVDIECGELLFDGCEHGGIHADLWQ